MTKPTSVSEGVLYLPLEHRTKIAVMKMSGMQYVYAIVNAMSHHWCCLLKFKCFLITRWALDRKALPITIAHCTHCLCIIKNQKNSYT